MENRVTEILIRAVTLGILCLPIAQTCTAAPDGRQISINITGDVLLDRGVKTLIDIAGVEGVMKGVAPLFSSADYTLINLECPATDIVAPANKRYVFRADPVLLKGLWAVGVTHAGLANNHTLDHGESGFKDTAANLVKAGIVPFGAVTGKASGSSPAIIEKTGIMLAVFNVNMVEVSQHEGKGGEAGPCEASMEELITSVKSFHDELPEIHIIAFLHWGEEYSPFPTEEQIVFAHELIDSGADAVIGCHPHVIQRVEVYHGRPIAYSLGNLLFDQAMPETRRGLIVTLEFARDVITGVKLHKVEQISGAPHLAGSMTTDINADKTIMPSIFFREE